MILRPDTGIFIDLNGIATVEYTDDRNWLIIERHYLPNGKRIGTIELPPEPDIDKKVDEAIRIYGCDCRAHGMEGICCNPEAYEMDEEALIDNILDLLDGDDLTNGAAL